MANLDELLAGIHLASLDGGQSSSSRMGLVPIATASLTFVSLIQGKSRIPRRNRHHQRSSAPIYDAAPGSGKLFLNKNLFPLFRLKYMYLSVCLLANISNFHFPTP